MVENRKLCLPSDLHFEILLKLPVKSLLRLCSVSKTWHSIIHDRMFVKSYKHRSGSQVFTFNKDGSSLAVRSSQTFEVNNELCVPMEIRKAQEVIGCVDGLFLFESHDRLYLWNPCTRRLRVLPQTPPAPEVKSWNKWTLGTGFDPSDEDYKIVIIESNKNHHDGTDRVMIYAAGTNVWRVIPFKTKDDMPWRLSWPYIDHQRVRFQRAFYSIALTKDYPETLRSKRRLVSFDLITEEFSSASLPIEDIVGGEWFLKCAKSYSRLSAILIRVGKWSEWWTQGDGSDGPITWSKHCTFDMGYTSWYTLEVLNFDVNKVVFPWKKDLVLLYDESHEKKVVCRGKISTTLPASHYAESLVLLID